MAAVGASSLSSRYFLSVNFALTVSGYNQFILMLLLHPNQITNINSGSAGPLGSVHSQAGAWQSWFPHPSQARAVCLFSVEAPSAGMASTSFTHSHLKPPFVFWGQRTNAQGFSLW